MILFVLSHVFTIYMRQQAGAKFVDLLPCYYRFVYKWFYCQIFRIFCLPFTFRVVKGARTFFKTVCKVAKKVRLCCLLSLDLLSTFHEQMIYDEFITCSFATKEKICTLLPCLHLATCLNDFNSFKYLSFTSY